MLIRIQMFSAHESMLTSRGKVADTFLEDTWKRAAKPHHHDDTAATTMTTPPSPP